MLSIWARFLMSHLSSLSQERQTCLPSFEKGCPCLFWLSLCFSTMTPSASDKEESPVHSRSFPFNRLCVLLFLLGLAAALFAYVVEIPVPSPQFLTDWLPNLRPLPLYQEQKPEQGRIALCLVGGARAFELTGPPIRKYLVGALNRTDIFIHAPLDADSYKLSFLKDVPNLVRISIFTPNHIPETLQLRELLTSANSPKGIQGLLQYFSLVEGCLTMIEEHQSKQNFTYKWVIRTRLDGYWSKPFPPLGKLDPEVYTVPLGSQYGGLNDRLGVGNWRTSKVALSRLSMLPVLHAKGRRSLNSETAFKSQLMVAGVKFALGDFPFCVLSQRSYAWPPGYWGVPVMSISSNGSLSGAKCRPCRPAAVGVSAKSILEKQSSTWSGIRYSPSGTEMCNAQGPWEKNWEAIYDTVVGPDFAAARITIQNQTLAECVQNVQEFQRRVKLWDAPSPEVVCQKSSLA